MAQKRSLRNPSTLALILLILFICFNPLVIVNAGERGVLLQFGRVREEILGEGLHPIIPIVYTVNKISVRIQKQDISAEASSKDLQEVFTDVALNWHIVPEQVNRIFQQIGNEQAVIDRMIDPAIEEVLKAVMAKYTAEEIITKRGEVKAEVDELLTTRLSNYYIKVDDISLVHIHFTERFSEAVEAKQIAEQEAKKAGFAAIKAMKDAEVKVNLAKGEAEADKLIKDVLTPEILQKEAIDKWNGNLPLIMGNDDLKLLDLNKFIKTSQK
jgi:prohibitin 1